MKVASLSTRPTAAPFQVERKTSMAHPLIAPLAIFGAGLALALIGSRRPSADAGTQRSVRIGQVQVGPRPRQVKDRSRLFEAGLEQGRTRSWLEAPLAFLTGEEPRSAAAQYLASETERARTSLDAAFRRRTGGLVLRAVSTLRSFSEQAYIVANVLRDLGLNSTSDTDAIRRGLLQSLTTRSIPGFSRHHWGSEVDVLTADSAAWRPGGSAAAYVDPLIELAPAHGLYHPYRAGAYPDPERPHYNPEPWHLSLIEPGELLRQRWLREIGDVPAQYNALLDRGAAAIASNAGLDVARTRAALGSIDLASYVRNAAPSPTGDV